ncbi:MULTISPECIES: LPS-assembly protein LptD [unclassified Acidovorax]|uniref:LPS-assembly protein LptD n=1 Tax=unclassified Acidovorax TaxID=2684926 RepID=UPI003857A4BC
MDRLALPDLLSPPPSPLTATAAAAAATTAAASQARSARRRVSTPRFERRLLAQLAAWMLCGVPLGVLAQVAPAATEAPEPAAAPAPALRTSPMLQETIPEATRSQLPTFIMGDKLTAQPDIKATLEGNAELRRGDMVIRADRMDYDMPEDLANATGNVHINNAGNVYQGSELQLKVDAFNGYFNDANYRFLSNAAHGEASRVDFIDRDRSVVHNGNYTTCQRTDEASWQPDWILRARTIRLDREADVGTAENAVLEFKGVPILPVPRITFPLSERRKSGLLPPTVGIDSVSGMEYSQPYYWNIAPNRDATITPTVMSKRGVNLGAEFRYLEPTYSGELTGDYLPGDRLRDRDRWAYGIKHQATIASPIGGLGLNVDLRRVSDDQYWRDFSLRGTTGNNTTDRLAQRLLPGEASLSWAGGDHSLSVRTVKWQTLQDIDSPIVPPYDRLPQLHWRYAPLQLAGGFDASVDADYTDFHADRARTGQPNARRSYSMAQISRPFLAPAGFITPRVQLHASQYEFDAPLANGQRSYQRTLPTFSLDSGLVFERDAKFFGRGFLQTLEPRAFYTYTPFRDQSLLPVYDTAVNDFNFASIYTENAFGGNDRFADNNLLTLGVTSRLLDPDTGAEAVRMGIAQRLRFSDQDVTMPGGTPVSDRLSDVLLGAGINWTPQWALDSLVQYNPKTGRSLRSTVGARYMPGKYRTISAAYRLQRVTDLITEPSEQVDVGWQWPISLPWGEGSGADKASARQGGRWFSVGRLNYSLKDRRLVDTVVGVEYEGCCWIGRVVLERLQSSITTTNTRLLFQIEFSGFSRLSLGSNPLTSLQKNVPGYQVLQQNSTVPSRFSNYD